MAGASAEGTAQGALGGGGKRSQGSLGRGGHQQGAHLNWRREWWWYWALDKGERCGEEKEKKKKCLQIADKDPWVRINISDVFLLI